MLEAILLFVALTWVAVHCGTMYIMQSSILPLLNSRDKNAYLDTCKAIDMHVFHPIALWGGIGIMIVGGYLVIQFENTTAQVITAIATVNFVAAGAISESTNRPIWRKVENVWTYDTTPDNWKQLRRRWSTAHTLRTLAAFVATVGFALAGILEFG